MDSAVGGSCARELLVAAVATATTPLYPTLVVCICCYVKGGLSDNLRSCAVYTNHLRRVGLNCIVCCAWRCAWERTCHASAGPNAGSCTVSDLDPGPSTRIGVRRGLVAA
jgi:hypothetical protein